jgi:hypothetical protein
MDVRCCVQHASGLLLNPPPSRSHLSKRRRVPLVQGGNKRTFTYTVEVRPASCHAQLPAERGRQASRELASETTDKLLKSRRLALVRSPSTAPPLS